MADDDELPHPLCYHVPVDIRTYALQWYDMLARECGFAPTVSAERPASQNASISTVRMSVELRRKLGRGAHHNMRLLVRGDLQTGKTQLWIGPRSQLLLRSVGIDGAYRVVLNYHAITVLPSKPVPNAIIPVRDKEYMGIQVNISQ